MSCGICWTKALKIRGKYSFFFFWLLVFSLNIYKPINDHIVVAAAFRALFPFSKFDNALKNMWFAICQRRGDAGAGGGGGFTTRCIYLLDSSVSQMGICMHPRILLSSTMGPALESHPVNARMNAIY